MLSSHPFSAPFSAEPMEPPPLPAKPSVVPPVVPAKPSGRNRSLSKRATVGSLSPRANSPTSSPRFTVSPRASLDDSEALFSVHRTRALEFLAECQKARDFNQAKLDSVLLETSWPAPNEAQLALFSKVASAANCSAESPGIFATFQPPDRLRFILSSVPSFDLVALVPAMWALANQTGKVLDLSTFALESHILIKGQRDVLFYAACLEKDLYTMLLDEMLEKTGSEFLQSIAENVWDEMESDSASILCSATLDFILNNAELPQTALFLIRKLSVKPHAMGFVYGSLIANVFLWKASLLEKRHASAANLVMVNFAQQLARSWLDGLDGKSSTQRSPRILSLNAKLVGVGQALRSSASKIELVRPRAASAKISVMHKTDLGTDTEPLNLVEFSKMTGTRLAGRGISFEVLISSNRAQIEAWSLGDTNAILTGLLSCSQSEVAREAMAFLDQDLDFSKMEMEALPLLPLRPPPLENKRAYKV